MVNPLLWVSWMLFGAFGKTDAGDEEGTQQPGDKLQQTK
jgi:hypothetical protein